MSTQVIKIAILAMGGEGGGVLADWIVDLAEHNGYLAQATSVPGVAQRTGATMYYLELFPRAQAELDGGTPVLALMPLPGDVDVVLASELMEAGRAVQRGLVTPDRTTLIASTHRVYSIAEKMAMDDGRVDATELLAHVQAAAGRLVCFDMARTAEQSGSVISAVLFGALAGTGVLPFERQHFEATVERSGLAVKASLQAFAAGFMSSQHAPAQAAIEPPVLPSPQPRDPAVRALVERVQRNFPAGAQALLFEGVRRLIDYQDPAYAALYLDRLQVICSTACPTALLAAVARHLALWMSYEDVVRVADLKTRSARFDRVQGEVGVSSVQLLDINEFMHPRLEEICDTLPAGLGRWLQQSGWPRRLIERLTSRGRVVRTSTISGFLQLYLLAGLRRWRRGSLRYARENQRIEQWLQQIQACAAHDAALALEVTACQDLIKGYGDTQARGTASFDTLMAVVRRPGTAIQADTLRELRAAALADESGAQLQRALVRHGLV